MNVWLFLIFSIFSLSPLFKELLGLGKNHYLLVLIIYLFYLNVKKRLENINVLIIIAVLNFLTSFISFFNWSFDIRILLYSQIFILSFIYCKTFNQNDIQKLITKLSYLVLILLIGCWISFFYSMLGGGAFYDIKKGIDPETSYSIILFTLVKNYWGQPFIRPSSIFDEPGALSFVICFVVLLRSICKESYKMTVLLLLLGFITFSLAHLLFSFTFFLSFLSSKAFFKYLLGVFVFFFSLFLILKNNTDYYFLFDKVFLSRLEVDSSGKIQGDNRSVLFNNALDNLNFKTFFLGVDSSCAVNLPECRKIYGRMGENPLSPIVMRGFLSTWMYYLFLFLYLIYAAIKRNLLLFGFFLLLLQRPYVLDWGYSFMSILPLYVLINKRK